MRLARQARDFGDIQDGGDSAFSPANIANLFAWWRADSGITLNGADVSAWASKVGSHNLVQATALRQPLLTTAVELNGQPVVRFDGVNERVTSNEAPATWRFLHDGTGCTAIVACVPRAGGGLSVWSTQLNTGGTGTWFRVDGSASALYTFSYDGATPTIISVPAAPGVAINAALFTSFQYAESAAPEWAVRSANVVRDSGATAAPPSLGDPSGTFSLCGYSNNGAEGAFDIAEVILYNRSLSAAENSALYNDYLTVRY